MKTSRTRIIALVSTLVLSISAPVSSFATPNGEFDRICEASGGTPDENVFGDLICEYPDGDLIACAPDLSECEALLIRSSNDRMDDDGSVIAQRGSLDLMRRFITP